jgi:hypothetical protein
MQVLLLGVLLHLTFTSASSADPLRPVRTGVVFVEALRASTWWEPVAQARTIRTIDRVANALQTRLPADQVYSVLRESAFEVHVFGSTPTIDVLEGFDIAPLSPAAGGPPTHVEWLIQVTPTAFRSSAPYRLLRPGTGW